MANNPSTSFGYGSPIAVKTNWTVALFVLAISLPLFVIVFIIGRFLARCQRQLRLRTDDGFILLSVLVFVGHCVTTVLLVVQGGAGEHIESLEPRTLLLHLKLTFISTWTYTYSVGFAKISICSLFIGMFPCARILKTILCATLSLIMGWLLISTILGLVICQPISTQWLEPANGHCGNFVAAVLVVGVIDLLLDLAMLVAPLREALGQPMSRLSETGLVVVIFLGLVDFGVGIRRITCLATFTPTGDWTYQVAELYFWSLTRPGLAIIVGCILTLRPILEKWIKDVAPLSRRSTVDRKHGYALSHISRRRKSEEEVADLLLVGDPSSVGGTRSIATTGSRQLVDLSLALADSRPPVTAPRTSQRQARDDVINVHRSVQVEEEQIETASITTTTKSQLGTPPRSPPRSHCGSMRTIQSRL